MVRHNQINSFRFFPNLTLVIITGLIILFTAPANGQVFYPQKDIIFTQVIASTGFDSIIAVTNRGSHDYGGDLLFYTGADGTVWNPLVNGTRISGGLFHIIIPPNETSILRITDTSFKVGYAIFYADDLEVDNNLEGNLTYYSHDSGTVLDAVGVPASKEFLVSSLPFSEFNDVGLSLAIPRKGPDEDASIRVFLYDENGALVSQCQFPILWGGHFAMFLGELPWESDISGMGPSGKVEIHSNRLAAGIGMTVTQGTAGGAQISTLPLSGTPLYYTLAALDDDENVYVGDVSFWIEGYVVNGFMRLSHINGETIVNTQTWKVTGQLIFDLMKLSFPCYLGDTEIVPEVSLFVLVPDFDPSANEISGAWSADLLVGSTFPSRGIVTFTRVFNEE